jgi:hypothetical protein
MPNKISTKLIYSPSSNGNVVFTGDIVNSYILFFFIVTPSSPEPNIMKSSSIGYFRLEQICELFPLLQMRIVYLCLLKNNMAVFFNNATNILYNEGTFLR